MRVSSSPLMRFKCLMCGHVFSSGQPFPHCHKCSSKRCTRDMTANKVTVPVVAYAVVRDVDNVDRSFLKGVLCRTDSAPYPVPLWHLGLFAKRPAAVRALASELERLRITGLERRSFRVLRTQIEVDA